jgi:RNA polymerase sigma factor (sigma-70 family)
MSSKEAEDRSGPFPKPMFVTTRWSVVLAAAAEDTTRAQGALAQLCQAYWYPLYAFARRRGCSPPDAQDLTQEFFSRLLKENWVAQADARRGRFRSFLLSAMKHFMTNEWHKAHAQKRGAHAVVISLDDVSAESRYQLEPASQATPEALFDRGWALTLLGDVLARLEAEYCREGRKAFFEALRPALTSDRGSIHYAGLAQKLGITENAARVAVHRLRQRYRQLIRAEVASTVASPAEVDEEMRYLFEVLARG